MTQLRKFRDSISNYFDDLTRGLGKRESSFMDLDAVSHDKDTGRFLFQEFKQPGELLHPAGRMVLRDLAKKPGCTVWFLRRLGSGQIGFGAFGSGRRQEVITELEYQRRFRCWWAGESWEPSGSAPAPSGSPPVTAAEIQWS